MIYYKENDLLCCADCAILNQMQPCEACCNSIKPKNINAQLAELAMHSVATREKWGFESPAALQT